MSKRRIVERIDVEKRAQQVQAEAAEYEDAKVNCFCVRNIDCFSALFAGGKSIVFRRKSTASYRWQ
jgi:hypothetical protein